ncbi:hypothetical protein TcG_08247 [Trypanosoma cruzi]|nr:hypothetical protein TcG_08247 [Trypanosoma cruzi]
MLVACTLCVTDGSWLVDGRPSTKVPGERCAPGGSETTGLRPIEDVVMDAVLQWRFLLSRSVLMSSPFCQFVFAVEELPACGAGVASAESSTLCVRSVTLSCVSHAAFPFSCWESCGCA